MTYQAQTEELAYATEAKVAAAVGLVSAAELAPLVAGVVAVANLRAVILADLAAAATLGLAPLGLSRPEGDRDRLETNITTLLELVEDSEVEDPAPRLGRLGRDEPLTAGQEAFDQALVAHEVVGWRRQTDANPCPLCQSWYAKGRTFPTGYPFPRHTGCVCVQVPVTEEVTI